ncbi:MAG TPA: PP2C family serine/threonine-protein phosphatase [Burkholderiales bacterium]|nr:PP2C family serine/threonine-protein phosphatase [Burkholderiales bacterium]
MNMAIHPEQAFSTTITQDESLQLRIGHASASVKGKNNEDFHGIVTQREESEARDRGIVIAVADGVSGNGGGRLASETAVKSLLRDFYAAPRAWSITRVLDKLLLSINDWLFSENTRHPEYEGMVTTLTVLVFKDRFYHLAHVGDTRIYRSRGNVFKQLTIDHTWERTDMRHVLKRAVGLDSHLVVDYTDGELLPGDVFLMASDGIWEVLGERVVCEALRTGLSTQAIAEDLVERSIQNQVQYMGRNDATAIVIAVDEV